MDYKKFSKLYNRLFEVAYDSDYINTQEKKYQAAVCIAAEIYGQYKLKDSDHSSTAKIQHYYLGSPINCTRAKKKYECSYNGHHIINQKDYYGRIYSARNIRDSDKVCLVCLAKILILVLTKFPPSSVPVEYSTIADDFDIDVLD